MHAVQLLSSKKGENFCFFRRTLSFISNPLEYKSISPGEDNTTVFSSATLCLPAQVSTPFWHEEKYLQEIERSGVLRKQSKIIFWDLRLVLVLVQQNLFRYKNIFSKAPQGVSKLVSIKRQAINNLVFGSHKEILSYSLRLFVLTL